MDVGDRVRWAGVQDPRCAPGFNGTVLATARRDPDSLKVEWDERPGWLGRYTWERRANLRPDAEGAGSLALSAA